MMAPGRKSGLAICLYGMTLFLGALLLFLVQPLLGKLILPWFGGTAAVWASCMLFFQVLLLAGYCYAHLLTGRLTARKQAMLHCVLLAASLLTLPILPRESWKLSGGTNPVILIIGLLVISAGAPYFMLSTASPLLQSWFSRVFRAQSPYRLYSLSNLGSLLAIISYPFLIEPHIPLTRQARIWSWGFTLFVLASGFCAWILLGSGDRGSARPDMCPSTADPKEAVQPPARDRWLWLWLPACSSALLLATTNQLCQDVAVIPLLWVLPLGIYLLSYILCFDSSRWYSRRWFGIALAAALAQACYVLHGSVFVGLRWQIASYSFTLFTSCMVLHGELVRLKPDVRHLTAFYGMIAAGGALGGAFVTLLAPILFRGFWEFHISLICTALLFLIVMFVDSQCRLFQGRPTWAWAGIAACVIVLAVSLGMQIQQTLVDSIEMTRNFFGVLRVLDYEPDNPREHRFALMHGRIEHGFQFQAPDKRNWPTSYFGPGSGVGVALRLHPNRSNWGSYNEKLRIGIVGLGAGTLAAYGRSMDTIRFYEINPEVVRLSGKYFSYVRNCEAKVEIILGDARISLERERERNEIQNFDVLAVDAFSSDAIPVHLLTRECLEVYRAHLKEDGILALHISSRYFDLTPVIRGLSEIESCRGMKALWVAGKGIESQGTDSTDWVLLTANRKFLDSDQVRKYVRPWSDDEPQPQVWTDDYSNLFGMLRR